jgi:hypothetical protein
MACVCQFNERRCLSTEAKKPLILLGNARILYVWQVKNVVKAKLKKEKWTLSFDRNLKEEVIEEAKRQGVYPVHLLESLVREKFNPFGHTDIKNEAAYVRKLRKGDKEKNDEAFLEEIRRWERINS